MTDSAFTAPMLRLAALLCLLFSPALHAKTQSPTDATADYAEHLYADYSTASSRAIDFLVKPVEQGPMAQLEGLMFSRITGEPAYRIIFDETRDGMLINGRFEPADLAMDRTELDARIDDFDLVGRPYMAGRYRLLSITATLRDESRHHLALEFCWDASNHCVVFDPQIDLMDSTVANHRVAKTQGIGPVVNEARATVSITDGKAAQCGLSSNRGIKARTLTWGARRIEYRNMFGITVVVKNLGMQQVGISCDAACMPRMQARSMPSTAWANVGYSAACDNGTVMGTTGRNGKAVAETRCAHKVLGGASARVAGVGAGARVGLAWATIGTVDATGGSIQEACTL